MTMTETTLFLQAIATRACLEVTYNRMRMKLAPHVLYTKHGGLHIDAVVVEREGRAFTEIKLGTFKLIGLQDVVPSDAPFHVFPEFDPADPKYHETTPFAIA